MVQRALKNLIELNAPVLGAVLNNIDIRGNGYPYYYSRHYYQAPSDPSPEPHPEEREVQDDFPMPLRAGGNKSA
jgi:Mrp family chromosome partitioning ATPase